MDLIERLNLIRQKIELASREAQTGYSALQDELKSLESLTPVTVAAYWQNGVYLYLLHPKSNDRPRHREYVGNDPARIAEALSLVSRGKRIKQLLRVRRECEKQVKSALRAFNRGVTFLERVADNVSHAKLGGDK